MSQDVTFIIALGLVLSGVLMSVIAMQLPRFWKWVKFKVWHDLQYSRGYRAGMEEGRRVERRWADES